MATFRSTDPALVMNKLAYVLEGLEHTIDIESIDYNTYADYTPAVNIDLAYLKVRIRLHPADLKNLNERLSRL